MSYCKFGPSSNVDLSRSANFFTCSYCRLDEVAADVIIEGWPSAIKHLEAHLAAGHKVPPSALDRLRDEMCSHEHRDEGKCKTCGAECIG